MSETDSCSKTLEAYKQYLFPLLDDYWHVRAYQEYAGRLAQWENCCPGGRETVERLRFEKAIPNSPEDLPLPSVFAEYSNNFSCYYARLNSGQQNWYYDYSKDRERNWKKTYEQSHQALYDCCVDQFEACLKSVGRPDGTAPTSADSERCLQQFSPQYQQQTAAESGDRQHVPSGWTVITAWPESTGSLDWGLLTAAVVVGFICGPAGRQRWWTRLGSRLINGVFAGLVFLGIVALLPDTQTRSLLLALAGAIIVTFFRLLIRSFFLLRRREQDAPVP